MLTIFTVLLEHNLVFLLKSIQNWVHVYIFLPLPKVTLSRQKIQTKNKQSHGTIQSYQIFTEQKIYLIHIFHIWIIRNWTTEKILLNTAL